MEKNKGALANIERLCREMKDMANDAALFQTQRISAYRVAQILRDAGEQAVRVDRSEAVSLREDMECLAHRPSITPTRRAAAYHAAQIFQNVINQADQVALEKAEADYAADLSAGKIPGVKPFEDMTEEEIEAALAKSEEDIKAGRVYTGEQTDIYVYTGVKVPQDKIFTGDKALTEAIGAYPEAPIVHLIMAEKENDWHKRCFTAAKIEHIFIHKACEVGGRTYLYDAEAPDPIAAALQPDSKDFPPDMGEDPFLDNVSAEEIKARYEALPWRESIIVLVE